MHPIISLDSSFQVSPVIEWKQAFLNFAKLYVISLIKNETPHEENFCGSGCLVALLVKKNFCDLCNHEGRRRPYLKSDTGPLLPPCIHPIIETYQVMGPFPEHSVSLVSWLIIERILHILQGTIQMSTLFWKLPHFQVWCSLMLHNTSDILLSPHWSYMFSKFPSLIRLWALQRPGQTPPCPYFQQTFAQSLVQQRMSQWMFMLGKLEEHSRDPSGFGLGSQLRRQESRIEEFLSIAWIMWNCQCVVALGL